MSESIPKTSKAWTIQATGGFDALKLNNSATVDQPGAYECLVKFGGVSLNYRDLIIPKGQYPFTVKEGDFVPGSDGAGEIVAVGPKVTRFKTGDKVITLFNQGHYGGSLTPLAMETGVGGALDGTFRNYGTFNENGLVSMPGSLNYLEASTLTCAALTAWNALYGLKPLQPGDVVLTQGTGGVSIFALQFAKAAGATVISTTSSPKKEEILKNLGADHIINYKTTADWGEKAKQLTPGGEGVTHIIEVGGPSTMEQSLKAIKLEGVISIIGFLGGVGDKGPSFLDTLTNVCTVRGVYVGSRAQFEDMNRAIEANKIKPVLNEKVFALDDLKDAYQYMWDQKHFGKLCIKFD